MLCTFAKKKIQYLEVFQRAQLVRYHPLQPVAVELNSLKVPAVPKRCWDLPSNKVLTDVYMPQIKKVAELRWQCTGQLVPRKVEPPQVGEVAELRCDRAGKAEPREVQCHDPTTSQIAQAAHRVTPLAHRNGVVAP